MWFAVSEYLFLCLVLFRNMGYYEQTHCYVCHTGLFVCRDTFVLWKHHILNVCCYWRRQHSTAARTNIVITLSWCMWVGVCVSVCLHDKTKPRDCNDLKLGTVVVLSIVSKLIDFEFKRSRVRVRIRFNESVLICISRECAFLLHCGSKKTCQLWRTITTTHFNRF